MSETEAQQWLRSTAIAVVGERGSGKTAFACHLLDQVKDRPVYFYQHPKPELLAERGWKQMYRLESLYDLHNAVCFVDEPQLTLPKLDKRANDGLQKLLSIARHRDLTLIFATCDSRWVTRALEAFIDVWFCKDVEPRLLKQGGILKRIIQKHVICDVDEFRLARHQFLAYARNYPELDGLGEFQAPEWFDERWSKPFSLTKTENCDKVAPKVRPSMNGVVMLGQTNGTN